MTLKELLDELNGIANKDAAALDAKVIIDACLEVYPDPLEIYDGYQIDDGFDWELKKYVPAEVHLTFRLYIP
nr:hypothetical protein [uncultured Dethiosulfovibrio sp.]